MTDTSANIPHFAFLNPGPPYKKPSTADHFRRGGEIVGSGEPQKGDQIFSQIKAAQKS